MSIIASEERPVFDKKKQIRTCEEDWKYLLRMKADFGTMGNCLHELVRIHKQYGHL